MVQRHSEHRHPIQDTLPIELWNPGRRLILFLATTICTPSVLQSADVDLFAEFSSPFTWDLYAMTSTSDNGGIASYSIEFSNATRVSHRVINQGLPGLPVNGFTISHSADDSIFAGHTVTNPDSLLYGIGNSDFAVPSPPPFLENFNMPPVGGPFAPVHIASGTTPLDQFDGSVVASVNVFDLPKGTSASAANVTVRRGGILLDGFGCCPEMPYSGSEPSPGTLVFDDLGASYTISPWLRTPLRPDDTRLRVDVLAGAVHVIDATAPAQELTIENDGVSTVALPHFFEAPLEAGASFEVIGPEYSFDKIDNPFGGGTETLGFRWALRVAPHTSLRFTALPGSNPADFDEDGDVDGDDFLIWQAAFPTLDGTASSSTGDANGDGNVGGDDFLVWQAEFGSAGARSGPSRVPEPAAIRLALLALFPVARRRRRA